MYKRAKVVMFPTKEKSKLFLKKNSTGHLDYNEIPPLYGVSNLGWEFQNLYIISDDEIKVGDYGIKDEKRTELE